MGIDFNKEANETTIFSLLQSLTENIQANLNCCRIAIVDEFYPEDLTVRVKLVNKMMLDVKNDGTQVVEEYPPIYAKVCYCNSNITVPINKDTHGILLFSDREIESWFINGQINQLNYLRKHDITDAIFIPAMYCLPIIQNAKLITECLHLFYGASSMRFKDTQIEIDTNTLNVSNNVNVAQTVTANNVIVNTGATGTFTSKDNKIITVENGIIKSIG